VVAALLEGGADSTVTNSAGMTALQVAVEFSSTSTANKHDAVIKLLQTPRK
jgi:ankyrin repeat protein